MQWSNFHLDTAQRKVFTYEYQEEMHIITYKDVIIDNSV